MTITLYQNTKLDLHKNYVIDDIELYLSDKVGYTSLDTFQYQRFELNKIIKFNMSQLNQGNSDTASKYDYLKISDTNGNLYYYFITKMSQKAQNTIEFECHMDVLNTFKYSNTIGNKKYTLTDKTLVTREHKNRLYPILGTSLQNLTAEEKTLGVDCFDGGAINEDSVIYFIGYAGDIANYVRQNGWFGMYWTYNSNSVFAITLYINNTNSGTAAAVHFLDNGIMLEDENGDDLEFYSWDSLEYDTLIGLKFLGGEDYDDVSWSAQALDVDLHQYYDYFLPDNVFALNKKVILVAKEIYRIIDKFQEGLESITFKKDEKVLYDQDGSENGWYIAYSSANAVVTSDDDTSSKYVNPVEVNFYSDYGYEVTTSTPHTVRFYATQVPNVDNYREYVIVTKSMLGDSGYIEINGVRYTKNDFPNEWGCEICLERINNTDMVFTTIGFIYKTEPFGIRQWLSIITRNLAYVDFNGVNQVALYKGNSVQTMNGVKVQNININSGTGSTSFTCVSFEELDLTDPKLIKVINFPYAPLEELAGEREFTYLPDNMVEGNNCLTLNKVQKTKFNRNIEFENSDPFSALYVGNTFVISPRESRNKIFESKLYHSDFYCVKFVYDSFAFQFRLEDMNLSNYIHLLNRSSFIVQYACSNNIQSKFLFKFNTYVCDREVMDFNDVLLIDRNNEKALYTNAYINYIKAGGFRYDTKNADTQKLSNGLAIAFSTIGSIVSFASASVTGGVGIASGIGLGIGAASKITSSIISAQQNDRAIAQKVLSLTNQSTSVSTCEDIDLLKIYSNNKAKICYYKISEPLEDALWDLFHFFGYKCNQYKIPSVDTRCNFNFVQAEIVFGQYRFNEVIANEIRDKWKEGVTFFHKYTIAGVSSWDIDQVYENFETNLF